MSQISRQSTYHKYLNVYVDIFNHKKLLESLELNYGIQYLNIILYDI